MQQSLRILICPLDWGMGHATRCVPIIRALLANNAVPIIAGPEWMHNFYRSIFLDIQCVVLKGKTIRYHPTLPAWVRIMSQVPKFLHQIYSEQKHIHAIVKSLNIDGIISDNRYGCYHEDIPSCIISHQVNPELPKFLSFAKRFVNLFLVKKIEKFNELWIPDIFTYPGFAGKMSHPDSIPQHVQVKYIGLLSRLYKQEFSVFETDLVVLCSGPEPQRTIFENLCIQLAHRYNLIPRVLGGITSKLDDVNQQEIGSILQSSRRIICRSGYSTLMDLICIRRKALIVATPGQPEQEYLARHFERNFNFEARSQHELKQYDLDRIKTDSNENQNYSSYFELHKPIVQQFLNSCNRK